MLAAALAKFKKLRTNLHIKRTIGLVWSVAPKWTAIVLIVVILESGLFFCSLYFLKLLINAVAKHAGRQSKEGAAGISRRKNRPG